ncbi:rod shape-determining protein RodA [Pelagirhabdus alkalitolerans]|uniref:Rod shape-determining protein RodA n=1 Tax=Pelagirhabdus alkalitolerans TaxID=1612202 RepID=A0A1G6KGN4_9BACI|nr:rod shape-determining protein RodA [Pelagirhabdus alkalitolerans]SDC29466.1 rod shape-determining protein RodA [Pelagirhabdus alkalitolerans]
MQSKKLPIDYTLVFLLGCLFIFSLLAIYSGSGQYASGNPMFFVQRQIMWYVIGFGVMMGVAYLDFELLEKWTLPFYISGVLLLILVRFIGIERNGAQRWLDLVVIEIQPSEFMKIFLVLHIAALLTKVGKYKLDFKESIPVTSKILLYTLLPTYLILDQPDLGTTMMILFAVFGLIFASSISMKMVMLLFSLGIAGVMTLVYLFFNNFELFNEIIADHQLSRIYGWLNPAEYSQGFGYQLQQALLGIGSGQLSGSGFTAGYQVQSGRIPEAHTDFIFAVIGEDFGFVGASILVILFFLLIYRIITIAFHASSLFGVYICIGVIGLFAFQVFQNIGMTIGLMPITGLALPFVSYGGSALLTNMMAIGLVTSVHLRTKEYMFSSEETI